MLSAGGLDTSFGTGGSVLANAPASKTTSPFDVAYATAIQTDGKVLAAGQGRSNDQPTFEVVRLNTSGSLDSSFGSGGRVMPVTGGTAYDMALQPDGRIILVGSQDFGTTIKGNYRPQFDIAVVRLLSDGRLDASFSGGKVTTAISTSSVPATADGTDSIHQYDSATTVAVQADGKIVVGGLTYNGSAKKMDSVLVRYNADGTLDSGFGQGGRVVKAWSAADDFVLDLAIQAEDGKIVVAGEGILDSTGRPVYYVARYNTDGSLDDHSTTDATPGDGFGVGGVVTTPFAGRANVGRATGHPLALQSDGAIVFARYAVDGTDDDLAVARFTAAGSLDTSFGGGTGVVTLRNLANKQGAMSVAVQADGGIVVAGETKDVATNAYDSLVARFRPDGTPDSGFGAGGDVIRSFSNSTERFNDVALQADGKIVAVGLAHVPYAKSTTAAFLIARFQGDSAPLLATSVSPVPVHQTLTPAQARPVLAQALSYWRARGADTSTFGRIDVGIADLGGDRLGEASGTSITLDDNAAGWGWFVGRSSRRGRKALTGRMDLISALIHEVGHLLGHGHDEGGVMAETLSPGVR